MSEIDFAALNEAALSRCLSLLEELLPGGRARGRLCDLSIPEQPSHD